jgi:Tol biopolymer transport system component
MPALRTNPLVACLSVILACTAGCDGLPGPPEPGAIMVVVQQQGTDLALGGYGVSVDAGPPRALDSPSFRVTFTNLDPSDHTVRLEGLAANCSVVGQNPMTVTVASNQTTVAQFTVACVANFGTVRVSTVTTGSNQDPSGYLVMVDGVQRSPVGLNAAVAIADVRVGLHAVSLGDVASTCRITTPHPVNVTVTFHGTVEVAFNIQCAVPGNLTVTVVTTGVELDPDGYTVDVQAASVGFSESRSVPLDGSVTFTSLLPATDYRVTLGGVSANCGVAGPDRQTVEVVGGGTTSVTFEVSCEAPRLLAIVRDDDIYVITSNGTGATRLTTDPAFDGEPAWSSTGQIAFTTQRHSGDTELYVMNANGTNPVRITTSAGADDAPSWSADGGKIVFRSFRDVNSEIYVVNANGTGLTRLTNNAVGDFQPAWSSTGQIAFVSDRDHPKGEIYVMNADGSNVVRLTSNDSTETSPAWSPDGSMIAFAREVECYYGCTQDIFVMNADGSNARRLATGWATYEYHTEPSWSPNGRAIAFTRQYCGYYGCDVASVWLVELQGAQLSQITNNGANPAWKP